MQGQQTDVRRFSYCNWKLGGVINFETTVAL